MTERQRSQEADTNSVPYDDIGLRYRGAVELRDGTALPCVVFGRERVINFIYSQYLNRIPT